ncbi:tetratricopeptide repeat protein [Streptomyces boncukensis]|uniref:Uncharacterized protein n=1 Tax=Streptomyces boncukensis TaxID=2711219 RepID=A0A6G4WZ14_9ACTN|nr:hypothetical protein [Streptomyces boncukensis]NGO70102.1 hypothetical protein [Streptomyces boncukensis]
MTPPPPPLTFRRFSEGRRPDPALDDDALRSARDAFVRGHWTEARGLLLATGDDWDRRGHRCTVLAAAPAAQAWAREWLQTEPDSADAAVLLACATAVHAARGKQHPNTTREAIATAVRTAPADPTPWLALLLLFRATATPEDCRYAFEEARARHGEHHRAHHLMAASLAEKGPEVYDFATAAAERAPADSPLALLPVVAHAERFRVLAAARQTDPDPTRAQHWTGRYARLVVRAAFNWWLEWGAEDSGPHRLTDLNYLAYAKFHEGRMAEAAALFQRIGPHITPEPWSFSGRDPHTSFHTAHRTALGTA